MSLPPFFQPRGQAHTPQPYCTQSGRFPWIGRSAIGAILTAGLAIGLFPELARATPETSGDRPSFPVAQTPNPNAERRQRIREGNQHFSEREYEAAEAVFRQLLEDYPQDSLLRYKLGNTLFAQYRYEEAVRAYEEAIRLNEDHALAFNALGSLRARQGRLDEAVSLFDRALAINDDYVDALRNLGRVQAQRERYAAAADALSQALEILVSRDDIWQAIDVARELEAVRRLQGLM